MPFLYLEKRNILISMVPGAFWTGPDLFPGLLHLDHVLFTLPHFSITPVFIKFSIRTLRFHCFLGSSYLLKVLLSCETNIKYIYMHVYILCHRESSPELRRVEAKDSFLPYRYPRSEEK